MYTRETMLAQMRIQRAQKEMAEERAIRSRKARLVRERRERRERKEAARAERRTRLLFGTIGDIVCVATMLAFTCAAAYGVHHYCEAIIAMLP